MLNESKQDPAAANNQETVRVWPLRMQARHSQNPNGE
jgi:hypothetical protein